MNHKFACFSFHLYCLRLSCINQQVDFNVSIPFGYSWLLVVYVALSVEQGLSVWRTTRAAGRARRSSVCSTTSSKWRKSGAIFCLQTPTAELQVTHDKFTQLAHSLEYCSNFLLIVHIDALVVVPNVFTKPLSMHQ